MKKVAASLPVHCPCCVAAHAELQLLRAELAEEAALRERLSYLLTHTAGALKGRPKPLYSHGWSDLPKVAAALRREATAARLHTPLKKDT